MLITLGTVEWILAASADWPNAGFLSFLIMFNATGFMVFSDEDAELDVPELGILIITGLTLLPPCFAKSTEGTGGVLFGVVALEPFWPTDTMAALPPMTWVAGMGLMTAESRNMVEAMEVRASEGAILPGLLPSTVTEDMSEYVESRKSPGMNNTPSENREVVLDGVPTADGIGGTGGTCTSLFELPDLFVTPGI